MASSIRWRRPAMAVLFAVLFAGIQIAEGETSAQWSDPMKQQKINQTRAPTRPHRFSFVILPKAQADAGRLSLSFSRIINITGVVDASEGIAQDAGGGGGCGDGADCDGLSDNVGISSSGEDVVALVGGSLGRRLQAIGFADISAGCVPPHTAPSPPVTHTRTITLANVSRDRRLPPPPLATTARR